MDTYTGEVSTRDDRELYETVDTGNETYAVGDIVTFVSSGKFGNCSNKARLIAPIKQIEKRFDQHDEYRHPVLTVNHLGLKASAVRPATTEEQRAYEGKPTDEYQGVYIREHNGENSDCEVCRAENQTVTHLAGDAPYIPHLDE